MQHIYHNYDWDVACCNFFELIVSALIKTAMPDSSVVVGDCHGSIISTSDVEGDGRWRQSQIIRVRRTRFQTSHDLLVSHTIMNSLLYSQHHDAETIMQLNKLALDALCAILNPVARSRQRKNALVQVAHFFNEDFRPDRVGSTGCQ